jgi:diaminopimelate epimerase
VNTIPFSKYHGTGNDFVLIDDRDAHFDASDNALIARMCDRHLGIGADGLILIRQAPGLHFRMVYFNSDGLEGSMCGNGARCAVAFFNTIATKSSEVRFLAHDGEHRAWLDGPHIVVSMADVQSPAETEWGIYTDTGSPHLVVFDDRPETTDVFTRGKELRYNRAFQPRGVNVNFLSVDGKVLTIRTYERGVEAETLSCGTGAVAAAVAAAARHALHGAQSFELHTRGGLLHVTFEAGPEGFTKVTLAGPAQRVFSGSFYP